MQWIIARIKWIMLISGLLTATMFYAAIAPQAALASMFGDSLDGPLAEIVVRNWGVLIGLVGIMLIYGAFKPQDRPLILTIASVSKAVFIGLVLIYGTPYLAQAGLALIVDTIAVLIFIAYLVMIRRDAQ